MTIPAEFTHRVVRTKLSGLTSSFEKLDQIRSQWPGSEIDVLYESGKPIIVLVFESEMDCLAYTLKYGNNYV